MLIESIRRLFGGTQDTASQQAATPSIDPLHLAACVLLLDIAHADGEFSDTERAHIEASSNDTSPCRLTRGEP